MSRTRLAAKRLCVRRGESCCGRTWFTGRGPQPVRIREFADAVCELLDLPRPVADLPLAEHHRRTWRHCPGSASTSGRC
ncbi:hypothetical protein D5S19_13605 [Amycolatopsis panacis]|uniref:Uncharacterized protein n=1 Tax=Amycolatopsis panacis TaxID=2340917 RepID=A0A419I4Y5_9PSEU|nr:hypothetical protein D5S19_13605 [Amycolatopsis panacis]